MDNKQVIQSEESHMVAVVDAIEQIKRVEAQLQLRLDHRMTYPEGQPDLEEKQFWAIRGQHIGQLLSHLSQFDPANPLFAEVVMDMVEPAQVAPTIEVAKHWHVFTPFMQIPSLANFVRQMQRHQRRKGQGDLPLDQRKEASQQLGLVQDSLIQLILETEVDHPHFPLAVKEMVPPFEQPQFLAVIHRYKGGLDMLKAMAV